MSEFPSEIYDNNTITDECTHDYTNLIAQSVIVDPDKIKDGDRAQVNARVKMWE